MSNKNENIKSPQQLEVPEPESSVQESPPTSDHPKPPPEDSAVPALGRRAAFRDVRRQLSDEELTNPGVQKLLLDILQESDDERDRLTPYIDRYHEADKTAEVLREKIRTNTAIEVFFGVGVGLGGAIIGLTPFFWDNSPAHGAITGIVGFFLMTGSTVGRLLKK